MHGIMWKIFWAKRLIFLFDRFQRVLLNSQTSKLSQIKTGVTYGSILRPFLFLVYLSNLPAGLTSNAKLFANDASIFSVVCDSSSSLIKI